MLKIIAICDNLPKYSRQGAWGKEDEKWKMILRIKRSSSKLPSSVKRRPLLIMIPCDKHRSEPSARSSPMWSPCVGGEKNYAQRRKKTKVVNRTITKKNGKKAIIMITTNIAPQFWKQGTRWKCKREDETPESPIETYAMNRETCKKNHKTKKSWRKKHCWQDISNYMTKMNVPNFRNSLWKQIKFKSFHS